MKQVGAREPLSSYLAIGYRKLTLDKYIMGSDPNSDIIIIIIITTTTTTTHHLISLLTPVLSLFLSFNKKTVRFTPKFSSPFYSTATATSS